MSIRRQIFISFVIVAALPLMVAAFFLFQNSVNLGFALYTQNMRNATELQSHLFDNSVNSFMVRATQFASSDAVQQLLLHPERYPENILEDPRIAAEIIEFTDETLDSVIAFSIVNEQNKTLYSSGSNHDIACLQATLPTISLGNSQNLSELLWDDEDSCLFLTTPIEDKTTGTPIGTLAVVYDSDFFLKGISIYQQSELTNSIIYCANHLVTVREKKKITGMPENLSEQLTVDLSGAVTFKLDGKAHLGYYKRIQKTPWVLINYIPKAHIYVTLIPYGLLGAAVLAAALIAILVLSRVQSRRILTPLNRLLDYVEALFVSGAKNPPVCDIDGKTEIGYLAEKFKGMSAHIAFAQTQLKESNYLYQSILHATYALRIIINYEENTATCSNPDLTLWLDNFSELDAPDAVLHFFEYTSTRRDDALFESLKTALYGGIKTPLELEACCRYEQAGGEVWFRIIAVPIIADDTGAMTKLVLHFEDISNKKREELQLLESSQRDPLCRLLNKHAFGELAESYMQGKKNHAVFFIDLDNFKQVNDRLGHAVGDTVLISCAQTICAQFSATDLVARFGGDEFVVLASGLPVELTRAKADSLVKKLQIQKLAPEGDIIRVTASVGVYITPSPQPLDTMTQFADDAMYQAKNNGKARYCLIQKGKEVLLECK